MLAVKGPGRVAFHTAIGRSYRSAIRPSNFLAMDSAVELGDASAHRSLPA